MLRGFWEGHCGDHTYEPSGSSRIELVKNWEGYAVSWQQPEPGHQHGGRMAWDRSLEEAMEIEGSGVGPA